MNDVNMVPKRSHNEADKDLEQRYAKVCAWLDSWGMVDISFEIGYMITWLNPQKQQRMIAYYGEEINREYW